MANSVVVTTPAVARLTVLIVFMSRWSWLEYLVRRRNLCDYGVLVRTWLIIILYFLRNSPDRVDGSAWEPKSHENGRCTANSLNCSYSQADCPLSILDGAHETHSHAVHKHGWVTQMMDAIWTVHSSHSYLHRLLTVPRVPWLRSESVTRRSNDPLHWGLQILSILVEVSEDLENRVAFPVAYV
ncbi:uncharacterized protein P174DRAFT_155459 [Aspergillus novofumigatus IBT 16806]|uniref:Uncharacterized protein n=1 Tax=Aspergillus novofumigatus (strain IBT 16806) TaxID=1392255 RepID=A0A2I1CF32_ASPN1|nr:uncharacterized protein P174DRAFT_155459 [Aspergillus novofumigatus IBT 16806]PKX96224.1 hypothetical protein P174DRAFT_155459 [Aspergillus novofumigatus IBT 16806]